MSFDNIDLQIIRLTEHAEILKEPFLQFQIFFILLKRETNQPLDYQWIGTNQWLDSERIGTNQTLDSQRIGTNQWMDSQRIGTNQRLDSQRIGDN